MRRPPRGARALAGWRAARRSRRAITAFATTVLIAACGDAPKVPVTDLRIAVTADVREVAFGSPFSVIVERVWDADLKPEEWSDETLAPLVVSASKRATYEADGRVLERRTFVAHAFAMGDVRVLPPLFVATETATREERTTTGEPLDLFVTPTLDSSAPGTVEYPPGPPSRSPTWTVILVGMGGLLAMGAAVLAVRRRRRPAGAADAPSGTPEARDGADVRALARIVVLRASIASSGTQSAGFHDEVSDALRTYVVARWTWSAATMTSEDLAAAASDDARGVGTLLASCDLIRFAGATTGPTETARLLDDLEHFVRETSAT